MTTSAASLIRTAADAEALAAEFLAARRARHLDFRMEAADPPPDDDADDTGDSDDQADDDAGTDQLGDAGKQAIDRMKAQRNQAREQLRAYRALGLTPEQVAELVAKGQPGGDQPDPDEIRRQARAEARAETQRERVVDKIEARAAKQFADPEDAVAILLRSRDAGDFLDGDKIDTAEIDDALTELLERKPHLGAATPPPKKFNGRGDQGPRDTAPKRAASLQDAVIARLAPSNTPR